MSESSQHIRLVQLLRTWVAVTYFEGQFGHLLVDSPVSDKYSKPPAVYGFVPDLYARKDRADGIIIGEAKTPTDLESHHSRDQFAAFLKKCAEEPGSVLVVATPWYAERTAKILLRDVQRRANLSRVGVVVLEQLGA